MGFDYSYIIVTKKKDKPELLTSIATHVIMENTRFGACATIAFNTDESIRDYLKDALGELEKNESPNQLLDALKNATVEIGYIYFDIHEDIDSQHVFTRFTAATTNMSLLFFNSISVKDWFIDFGKKVNAIAVFLDLEDQDYKFVFKEGSCVDVSVNGTAELNFPEFYQDIIHDYQNY